MLLTAVDDDQLVVRGKPDIGVAAFCGVGQQSAGALLELGPRTLCSRPVRRLIFRPRPDHELFAMQDEELVRYVAEARRAGAREHAVTATHMLLFKHEDRMRRRVSMRVPNHLGHHTESVAEWVLERIARSALALQVRGESVREWVNRWTNVIDRQVISYWTAQGKALECWEQLASEHEGEEGSRPDRLGEDFDLDRLLSRRATGTRSRPP